MSLSFGGQGCDEPQRVDESNMPRMFEQDLVGVRWEQDVGPPVPGGPGGSSSFGYCTMPAASPKTAAPASRQSELNSASSYGIPGYSLSRDMMPAPSSVGAAGHFDLSTSAPLDVSSEFRSEESRRLDAFFSCLCESLVATLRAEFTGHLGQERENLRRQHESEVKRLQDNHRESLRRLVSSLHPGEMISLQPGESEFAGFPKVQENGLSGSLHNTSSWLPGTMTPDPARNMTADSSRAPATPGRARSPEIQLRHSPEIQVRQSTQELSRATLPARLAHEMKGVLVQSSQPHLGPPPSPQAGGLRNHPYVPSGNPSFREASPPPEQRQVVPMIEIPSAAGRRNLSPPPAQMSVVASGAGTPQTQPRQVSRTASPLTQKRFPVVQVTAPQNQHQHTVAGRAVYAQGSPPAAGVVAVQGPMVAHGARGNSPPPAHRGTPVMPQPGYACQVPSRDSSYKSNYAGPAAPIQVATTTATPDLGGAQSVGTCPAVGLSFNPPPVNSEWLGSPAAPALPTGSNPPTTCPPAHERAIPTVGRQSSYEQPADAPAF